MNLYGLDIVTMDSYCYEQRGEKEPKCLLFCGGKFHFDYHKDDYRIKAEKDYRVVLLGGVNSLLEKSDMVYLSNKIAYVGPFYFESDGLVDADIVKTEMDQIRRCTDAFFVLEDGLCPGTIAEMVYACAQQKKVRVFYVKTADTEETESSFHSPCWYPMIMCLRICPGMEIVACTDIEDAKEKLLILIHNL